jgi:hypothetical protein
LILRDWPRRLQPDPPCCRQTAAGLLRPLCSPQMFCLYAHFYAARRLDTRIPRPRGNEGRQRLSVQDGHRSILGRQWHRPSPPRRPPPSFAFRRGWSRSCSPLPSFWPTSQRNWGRQYQGKKGRVDRWTQGTRPTGEDWFTGRVRSESCRLVPHSGDPRIPELDQLEMGSRMPLKYCICNDDGVSPPHFSFLFTSTCRRNQDESLQSTERGVSTSSPYSNSASCYCLH